MSCIPYWKRQNNFIYQSGHVRADFLNNLFELIRTIHHSLASRCLWRWSWISRKSSNERWTVSRDLHMSGFVNAHRSSGEHHGNAQTKVASVGRGLQRACSVTSQTTRHLLVGPQWTDKGTPPHSHSAQPNSSWTSSAERYATLIVHSSIGPRLWRCSKLFLKISYSYGCALLEYLCREVSGWDFTQISISSKKTS